tara:strand:+ start:39 stop:1904 length:1866 start_codon:yes stop_codon:yes gene_type:complete
MEYSGDSWVSNHRHPDQYSHTNEWIGGWPGQSVIHRRGDNNYIMEDVNRPGNNQRNYGPCHNPDVSYGCGYNVMCYLGWFDREQCLKNINNMQNQNMGPRTSGLTQDLICRDNNDNLPGGSISNYYPWSPLTPCSIYENIKEQMNYKYTRGGFGKTNSYVIVSLQFDLNGKGLGHTAIIERTWKACTRIDHRGNKWEGYQFWYVDPAGDHHTMKLRPLEVEMHQRKENYIKAINDGTFWEHGAGGFYGIRVICARRNTQKANFPLLRGTGRTGYENNNNNRNNNNRNNNNRNNNNNRGEMKVDMEVDYDESRWEWMMISNDWTYSFLRPRDAYGQLHTWMDGSDVRMNKEGGIWMTIALLIDTLNSTNDRWKVIRQVYINNNNYTKYDPYDWWIVKKSGNKKTLDPLPQNNVPRGANNFDTNPIVEGERNTLNRRGGSKKRRTKRKKRKLNKKSRKTKHKRSQKAGKKKTRKKTGSKRRTRKKIENKNIHTVYKQNSNMSQQNMNTMMGGGQGEHKITPRLCNPLQNELFEKFTQNIIEHKKNEDILENYFKNEMKEEDKWVDNYYKNVYLKEDRQKRLAKVEKKLLNDLSKTQKNKDKKRKTQKKKLTGLKKLNKNLKIQ